MTTPIKKKHVTLWVNIYDPVWFFSENIYGNKKDAVADAIKHKDTLIATVKLTGSYMPKRQKV